MKAIRGSIGLAALWSLAGLARAQISFDLTSSKRGASNARSFSDVS